MKKISFIINNYCTRELVEKNIQNILDSYENCEVIFVDSGSSDGSADLVQEKFGSNPKVTLVRTLNYGVASAYNLGLERATGDYLLYLGTDAFPTKKALDSLVDYMDKNPDVGLATASLYTRDGSLDMDAHRGLPTPWVSITHLLYLDKLFPHSKFFDGYSLGYKDLSTVHEIDVCISHFMFVTLEAQKKVGKWDTDYWVYGEDIDFCYRIKQVGYKIMYLGNVKVLHYKGASVARGSSEDIKNVMNTDFDSVSFKNETIAKKSAAQTAILATKRVGSTKLWMRIKTARESTRAMRLFYKKHLMKKYPLSLTWLVFLGIWINEQLKVAKILINNYL